MADWRNKPDCPDCENGTVVTETKSFEVAGSLVTQEVKKCSNVNCDFKEVNG